LGAYTFAFADEPEKNVFGPDVVVAELQGFAERQLQTLLGPGGEGDVAGGRVFSWGSQVFDAFPQRFQADPHLLKGFGGDPVTFVDQTEKNVFGPDVVVLEQARFFLRENDDAACSISESLERCLGPSSSIRPSGQRAGATDYSVEQHGPSEQHPGLPPRGIPAIGEVPFHEPGVRSADPQGSPDHGDANGEEDGYEDG
jgi:hypothetical protein